MRVIPPSFLPAGTRCASSPVLPTAGIPMRIINRVTDGQHSDARHCLLSLGETVLNVL